ncbi:putative quinol monooxygenase [Amphritea sp.]|uniref:putative quinol monooxygenase n=1 Tax=Amphritea sp. TaxID=1872502 RepID=UPI003A906594
MTTELIIVARIEAKSDQIDLVKTELIRLIEPTREEAGCLQYDLHQDNNNPAVFLFYERWESRDLWVAHMDNVNLKRYSVAVEGAVESFILNEMAHFS